MAATNASLVELTAAGRFRADLTHRLSGFVLSVPSLVQRRDDVPLLASRFLRRIPGWADGELGAGVVGALCRHEWPGNVRELRHVVERAAVLSTPPVLPVDRVLEALDDKTGAPEGKTDDARSSSRFEQRRLLAVLEECDWDTAQAAARLGVHRATVYRRMQRNGLVRGTPPLLADVAGLPDSVRDHRPATPRAQHEAADTGRPPAVLGLTVRIDRSPGA